MARSSGQSPAGTAVWRIAARQHGVASYRQLRELGYSGAAIEHRIARRRLHRLFRGVYAVGRPDVTQEGWWMASVLACGNGAAVSHSDAAALWEIGSRWRGAIHVSVPYPQNHRERGIRAHRRSSFDARDVTTHHAIPVTTPVVTIVDIAASQSEQRLERAINEADQRGVLRFDVLREQVAHISPRPGLARVNALITRWNFRLTRSELERLFLPIARKAGLPVPQTRVRVNGFEVDFWFPELGVVVETDSLTYHRTPAKQLKDRRRDQAHIAAGLVPLRFTHWQIARERREVERILRKVAAQRAATLGPALVSPRGAEAGR